MTDMWLYIGIFIAILMVLVGIFLIIKSSRHSDSPTVDEVANQHTLPEPLGTIENPDAVTASVAQDAVRQDEMNQNNASSMTPDIIHQHDLTETASTSRESTSDTSQPDTVPAIADLGETSTDTPTDTVSSSFSQSSLKLNEQLPHATAPHADYATANQVPTSSTDNELDHELNDVLHQLDADVVYKIEDTQTAQTVSLVSVENLDQQPLDANILDAHLSEQDRLDEESSLATAQKLVALYLYPSPNRALSGERTLKILTKYGLRYGEMSCFHRYQDTEKASPLMFSVLRLNDDGAPSGFDLETLSNEEVKGLAFFLALPNSHAVTGYDMMVSLSGLMARDIDGMVFDEQGLELTPQLRDHWRHQVIEMNSKPTDHA